MMLWLRMMRCWIVQGLGRAVLWIILLGGAGATAYYTTKCDKDQICVQAIPSSKR